MDLHGVIQSYIILWGLVSVLPRTDDNKYVQVQVQRKFFKLADIVDDLLVAGDGLVVLDSPSFHPKPEIKDRKLQKRNGFEEPNIRSSFI